MDRGVGVRDQNGRVTRMFCALIDVTQRKLHEIELARARDEATESLERQTATAEILKVIACSSDDVQPVFDAIVKSALRLLGWRSAAMLRASGGILHLAALTSTDQAGDKVLRRFYPRPISAAATHGRAFLTRKAVSVPDTEKREAGQEVRRLARARGYRSFIVVPLLRGKEAIGTLSVTRREAGEFSSHQIELLQTFAAQAVIAIENARRFNETKEALEQQKASAEVLGAISSSIADTSPVFERILQSCELFRQQVAGITMLGEDGKLHLQVPRTWT
jgi:GAF domain-containing protein